MPPTTPAGRADSPEQLHTLIQDALNRGDLHAYIDAYDPDATVIVPPEGRTVRGHHAIGEAIGRLLELAPEMTTVVCKTLQTEELALTCDRWELTLIEHGSRTVLQGLGTMVSRRRPDGTWRVVLDDPLIGA